MKKITTTLLVGAATLAYASIAFAGIQPQLNEISRNDSGGDDYEFVEICGEPGTSLSSYTIVGIEGDGGSSTGNIDHIHPLSGVIGASGYYTVGMANVTCADELTTITMENGGLTMLLVQGFTGAQGQDIDANDDGIADGPIGTIIDAVGMGRPSQGDLFGYYGAVQIGPDTGDAGTSDFDPAGVARCDNCIGTWGITCLAGASPEGAGCDTNIYNQQFASPCAANTCGTVSVEDHTWGNTKALYR